MFPLVRFVTFITLVTTTTFVTFSSPVWCHKNCKLSLSLSLFLSLPDSIHSTCSHRISVRSVLVDTSPRYCSWLSIRFAFIMIQHVIHDLALAFLASSGTSPRQSPDNRSHAAGPLRLSEHQKRGFKKGRLIETQTAQTVAETQLP